LGALSNAITFGNRIHKYYELLLDMHYMCGKYKKSNFNCAISFTKIKFSCGSRAFGQEFILFSLFNYYSFNMGVVNLYKRALMLPKDLQHG